jgi:sodium transport system ATP-binding protein
MQEVAALADELVIIAHGRLAASGTRESLAASFRNADLEEIFVDAVARVAP